MKRLLHLVDRVGDEGRRVVGDGPGEVVGKALLRFVQAVAHRFQGRDRVRSRRLVDRDRGGGAAVEPRLAVEVGGAQFQPRDVAEAKDRAVGIGADDDPGEFLGRSKPALRLDVELQLLVVRDGPRADAADRGLHVLRLDRVDDVAGRQGEPGQPVGAHPGAHRVVLRPPQRRVADARRALDLVEQVDGHVVREEQRIVAVLRRIHRDDAEQCRRFLLHRDALPLHLLRQARQRDLYPVVDVDRVDVGVGAELERTNERVAAVIAADALHVHHLVDADDLRLDRLRHGRVDHRGIGAWVDCGDRHLRRDDVRILRQRNNEQ
jgi:hypothetical protein